MQCPKVALFDLDDTLAPPHVLISPETSERMAKLLSSMPVAVISAAPFERISRDVVKQLPQERYTNLYICSENGAQGRMWKNEQWEIGYYETISTEERTMIKTAILDAIAETKALEGITAYGPQLLDREAGVTFSTLGAGAPQKARETWDPDLSRRKLLHVAIAKRLPEWNVYIGGLTSIDISRQGVSKARAITWISQHLRIEPREMLYVGDALYEGGNDFVVIATGVATRQTKGPEDTLSIIDEILAACATR